MAARTPRATVPPPTGLATPGPTAPGRSPVVGNDVVKLQISFALILPMRAESRRQKAPRGVGSSDFAQRLLHVLDARGRVLEQTLALARVGSQFNGHA
jgi:hypothetical protein